MSSTECCAEVQYESSVFLMLHLYICALCGYVLFNVICPMQTKNEVPCLVKIDIGPLPSEPYSFFRIMREMSKWDIAPPCALPGVLRGPGPSKWGLLPVLLHLHHPGMLFFVGAAGADVGACIGHQLQGTAEATGGLAHKKQCVRHLSRTESGRGAEGYLQIYAHPSMSGW
jgi:hypothetical protein